MLDPAILLQVAVDHMVPGKSEIPTKWTRNNVYPIVAKLIFTYLCEEFLLSLSDSTENQTPHQSLLDAWREGEEGTAARGERTHQSPQHVTLEAHPSPACHVTVM